MGRTRDQPVSYKLESRRGSAEDFEEMVRRCGEAGVDISVDTVINHMTFVSEGVGTADTRFSALNYHSLYSARDFHDCDHHINDYNDRWQVQNCRLAGLHNLETGEP